MVLGKVVSASRKSLWKIRGWKEGRNEGIYFLSLPLARSPAAVASPL